MHPLPYNLQSPRPVRPAPRFLGLGLTGLLNIGFVVALVLGLKAHMDISPPTKTEFKISPPSVPKPPVPSEPKVFHSGRVIVLNPDWEYRPDSEPDTSIHGTTESPDVQPQPIGWTHTRRDYPPLSRTLNEEGSVRLLITINEKGLVSVAQVLHSSGFPRLDEAAVSWVKAHWRYQPAIKDGKPVPAKTNATVTFKLT
jgi:protein TonB